MLVLALLGVATATVGVPAQTVITIAAGRCRITVDGRPTTLVQLRRASGAWNDGGEVHFQPSPSASYGCVVRALRALRRSRATSKIAFIGNEQYFSPERGK